MDAPAPQTRVPVRHADHHAPTRSRLRRAASLGLTAAAWVPLALVLFAQPWTAGAVSQPAEPAVAWSVSLAVHDARLAFAALAASIVLERLARALSEP